MEPNRKNRIRSLLSFWGNYIVKIITSLDQKEPVIINQPEGSQIAQAGHGLKKLCSPQRGDTSQCPGQRWSWRIKYKKKLPGNRTRAYKELWTREFPKENRSRVKTRNFFHWEDRGGRSLLFLPGRIYNCCGLWLLLSFFHSYLYTKEILIGPWVTGP